ncbi:MAG: M14 family zinc carboxypeptidase [Armatimonadota bacterium]
MMKRIAILTIILVAAGYPAQADIVADIAALVPSKPHSYAELMTAMQELHETDRVHCSSIGVTRQGRHIPMAVVCDPEYDPHQLRKLLIIARQHGNEPAGTEAAMALIKHLATSEGRAERALLRNAALLVIPMVNPDGASSNLRRNSAGVDLNRDWVTRGQAETQAVERVFREWQADAFVDLHELPASSSKASYQENFVETIASHSALPALLGERCGRTSAQISVWMKRYGIPLNCYYDTPGDDTRLAHRHYGLNHQVPSYLFESKTGRGRTLRDRATYHILGMLVVANQLAYHHGGEVRPIQVASVEPAPASEPEREPQITRVMLADPAPDGRRDGRTLLWAEIESCEDFAYLTFELNGRMLVLTNQQPWEYSLDTSTCPEGEVELAARAYDASGRCIATDSRTMTLVKPGAALGQ